ncbi:MAG: hypothetical protein L0Z07_06080 [Planctomycetes bacterium]|nr:hypothetical protein [Planctomycetota bacterium]
MSVTDGVWRIGSVGAARRWPVGELAAASGLLAVSLGFFLVVRRAAGAISAPLAPTPLVLMVLVLLAWAWGVLAACRWLRQFSSITSWLPASALLLFAIACSYPGSRVVDWVVWLPAMAACLLGPWRIARSRQETAGLPKAQTQATVGEKAAGLAGSDLQASEMAWDSNAGDVSGEVLQQFTRFRTSEGQEVIHGTLFAEFRPGQRSGAIYLAFCPPFEFLPEIEVNATRGPESSIHVVQLLHNGVQLDVRLTQASERCERVAVELIAAEVSNSEDAGDGLPEADGMNFDK